MPIIDPKPTLHPDVNALLAELLASVRPILGDHFVGMYLFGSLSSGAFDRDSDVDVLVVVDEDIPGELFAALDTMHRRISALDLVWATQLEVSYIPKDALRRYDPAHNLHPHIDRGQGETLWMMPHDADWQVQRQVLREKGIIVAGPPPDTLIDPVSSGELRRAMLELLQGWTAETLLKPERISRQGYQTYTVLSVCRMLYTLEHGKVVSKPAAAHWAQTALGKRWVPLIEKTWSGRHNPSLDASQHDIHETLALIRYALKRCKQFERSA